MEEDFYTAQEAALLFQPLAARPRGIIKAGVRIPRQGWRQSPAGTEGGKSRLDYGLPNLTSWPLSVVNIRCSAFKAGFDAGRFVL